MRIKKIEDEMEFFGLVAGRDAELRMVLCDRISLFIKNPFNCANIAASGFQQQSLGYSELLVILAVPDHNGIDGGSDFGDWWNATFRVRWRRFLEESGKFFELSLVGEIRTVYINELFVSSNKLNVSN